jgi:poly[(R)-3-hydroxyalkanoate] polymerase subunit PhaE
MTTDTHTSKANSDDWLKAQMQFWENWGRMCTQNLTDADGMSKGNWADAMDQWWNVVAKNVPEHREIYDRMVEQGKAIMSIGQELTNLLIGVSSSAQNGDGWKEQLKSHFDSVKEAVAKTQSAGDLPAYLRGFASMCELPLDTMWRTMSGTAAIPGDFLQNLRPDTLGKFGDRVHEGVDKFLSVPGVGYTREGQEQLQTFARTLLDYQKALQEYLGAHNHLGMETLDRLYQKVVALGEKGEPIKTLRALYDLCVDCGEEAYAEFVMSSEFQEVYGKIVNALMAVKYQGRVILDENLGAMNMPTRREMNSIIRHQNELRRSIKSLQREHYDRGGPSGRRTRKAGDDDDGEMGALRNDVASLRKQVESMSMASIDETPVITTEKSGRPVEAQAPKKQTARK